MYGGYGNVIRVKIISKREIGGSQYMKEHNIKPVCKIILCIIVSLVIDLLFLYAEFKYFIELICFDTFFGLFSIDSELIANMLYAAIGLVAGLVVVLACKVLRLGGKGKKSLLLSIPL